MLPRYCIFTQAFNENVPGGNDRAEVERWYAYLGPTFHHMHHYCYGMMNSTRALLAHDAPTRNFYLLNGLSEYDYVLRAASPDFILLPELLAKRGDILIRLGRVALGLESLERALQVKADYWPAYVRISDYYVEAGDQQNARETLNRGLAAIPGSKTLQQRLAELDRQSASANAQSKRSAKPGSSNQQKSAKEPTRSGDATR